jgi:hypothetical protein
MIKTYELEYEIGEEGIFAMSTVVKPAVKSTLVMFSDEAKVFEFADDEKQIIYSVAMRPNVLIPREDIKGEPANVFYTEATADALLENFFKNNNHQGGTIDHGGKKVKDMFIFSAWKVLDPARDAATVMGLDVKRGDIVMGQKVNNPEVWQRIKNKELTGFSFEAILNPVLIETQIQMSSEEIDARIKAVIKMTAEEDAAMAKKLEEDEAAKLAMTAEEDAAAAKKKEEDEAAAKLAMADGSIMPDAEMEGNGMQKMIDDLTTENIALKAQIAQLEGETLTMKAETAKAATEAVKMSAQLAKGITPFSSTPAVAMKYEDMTNVQKVKFNRGLI